MKKAILALAATILATSAQPAHAGFLKRLADTAIQSATEKAGNPEDLVDQVVGQAIDAASQPREPKRKHQKRVAVSAPEETVQAEAPPAPPAAPAPRKASLAYDIKPSAALQQEKKTFLDFSRYDCTDCEGGRGFDAWAGQILEVKGDHGWEEKVGALEIGGTIEWKGRASDGALNISSENEVQGLRCKQVHYRLARRADHQLAERDGLFCFGKPDAYVGERWVEVY